MKKKITIEELKGMYGVTERTLNNWRRNKQLPIIEITPQQKWVYQDDLISWEKSFAST
jgi:hypothetical protein